MSDLFSKIRTSVLEDHEDEDIAIELLEQGWDYLYISDMETDSPFEHIFTLYDIDQIDESWIFDHIIICPSVSDTGYSIDALQLSKWIDEAIDKPMMMTLEDAIIIGDYEESYDYLAKSALWSDLETHELPSEEQLGITWREANKIIVNMEAIINTTEEMLENGEIYEWEKFDTILFGLKSTIAHEIRHLAQGNPYLPDKVLNQRSDDESDAEEYGSRIAGSGKGATNMFLHEL